MNKQVVTVSIVRGARNPEVEEVLAFDVQSMLSKYPETADMTLAQAKAWIRKVSK
ncbi:hypothetical protein ACFWGN_09915 [Oerskovia sp. NPDC060338]|uniref:hypothetical protein n=1 Tax=Oerskovia sp. NPDC060338 TaxID=3347100 RepID=UPI003661EBE6